ncbi:hypothetical protein C1H46_008936 [Malus baccata]|uniref:Uncharacterized protein n=1 Tax=Malus baccata TaxID=106549 RepID=A0A540N347_MALBA|nr:hypothetical protein C1H46_008936 [Malus baccata]
MVKTTLRIDGDMLQSLPSSITEDDDRSHVEKKDWGSPEKRGVAGASPEKRGDSVFNVGEEECLVCRIRNVWLCG